MLQFQLVLVDLWSANLKFNLLKCKMQQYGSESVRLSISRGEKLLRKIMETTKAMPKYFLFPQNCIGIADDVASRTKETEKPKRHQSFEPRPTNRSHH